MTSNLDTTTFNSPNGYTTNDFGTNPPKCFGYSIAIQTDGKIVMAGYAIDPVSGNNGIALSRYDTNGLLDTTTFNSPLGYNVFLATLTNFFVYSLALQPDGKIVVCGYANTPLFVNPTMFVARFLTNGLIDLTFGGSGYVYINDTYFNTRYPLQTFDQTYAYSVQIDTNFSPPKIVIGGNVRNLNTSPSLNWFSIVRLTSVGALDITFNITGVFAKNFVSGYDEFGSSLAITSGGNYILGGSQVDSLTSISEFAVIEIDTNGSPTTFGPSLSGIFLIPHFSAASNDSGASLKIQSDGKIVLGGTSISNIGTSRYAIARITPTGSLDLPFGSGGQILTPFTLSPYNLTGTSIDIQSNGKIILGGYFNNTLTFADSFSLARYNTNGSIDTTFGLAGNGLILEDIIPGISNNESGNSIAIQTDGKIVVGGTFNYPGGGEDVNFKFILARYFGFPPDPPPNPPPNPTPIPNINICFPAGTPVLTDQGNLPIEQINPEIHTIHRRPIIAITQSYMNENKIVCIEKHAFGINVPNRKTYISCYHGIMYKNRLIPSKQFVGRFHGVYYVKYDGEKLYNVLMERHQLMMINNMKVETLNPKNIVAKLYTNNYSNEEKTKIILEMNENAKNKKHHLYETKNGYETITGNFTRRRFSVIKHNPIISRINFHTRKHYLNNNQYSHTVRHHNHHQMIRPTIKLTPYTFKHGRRRR
uniref:Hedgehog/Intein (Hint) domain-containing protein n=1 Tax=viral metagenome TaxID=1070528 RepID=A0A6C0DST3_9ZZZZ